jgi:hypothetical protein
VFNVDYGDVTSVSPSDIRVLKDEFMILPFQAVECVIPERASGHLNNTNVFLHNIKDRVVVAEVLEQCYQCLEVYLHSHHNNNKWNSTSYRGAHGLTFLPG